MHYLDNWPILTCYIDQLLRCHQIWTDVYNHISGQHLTIKICPMLTTDLCQ